MILSKLVRPSSGTNPESSGAAKGNLPPPPPTTEEAKVAAAAVQQPQHPQTVSHNPMLVQCVLETFFVYVGNDELKLYRLVNRLWNTMATNELLRRKLLVHLEHLVFSKHSATSGPKLTLKDMARVAHFCRENATVPYEQVTLGTELFKKAEDEKILLRFLADFAPHMRDFTLSFSENENKQRVFKRDDFPQHLDLPKLTKLQIYIGSEDDTPNKDATRSNCQFLRGIMSSAPMLNVVIFYCPSNGTFALSKLLDAMHALGERELTFLSLSSDFRNKHILKLCNMSIKVSKLTLDFYGKTRCTSLRDFLQAQSSHLEQLALGSRELKEDLIVDLPRLQKLKTLEILGSAENSHHARIRYTNIDYARQLPALEQLEFHCHASANMDSFLISDTAETVETLDYLRLSEGCWGNVHVDRAASLFPNLVKLEIPASESMVLQALLKLPRLQQLAVNKSCAVWAEMVNRGNKQLEIDPEDSIEFELYHANKILAVFLITETGYPSKKLEEVRYEYAFQETKALVKSHLDGNSPYTQGDKSKPERKPCYCFDHF